MPPEQLEFASPEDRGDNIPVAATQANAPAVKTEEPPKVDEPRVEDPPRDEGGKFAKKERQADPDSEVRIPKSRFDEQVAKERDRAEVAERRAAELEARLNAQAQKTEPKVDPVAAKVDDLEARIEALHDKRDGFLVDGNIERAAEVRREIRAIEKELREVERNTLRNDAEQIAARRLDTQSEEQRIDTVVSDLESEFSVLRKGSDEYDPRMVNFVLVEQQRLIDELRLSPHEALSRAGKETMELFGHKPSGAKGGQEDKPETPADKRRVEARQKVADTMNRQPASLKDAGIDSDKAGQDKADLDVNKLSEAEFNALPAAQLAKLRGDFVE